MGERTDALKRGTGESGIFHRGAIFRHGRVRLCLAGGGDDRGLLARATAHGAAAPEPRLRSVAQQRAREARMRAAQAQQGPREPAT